MFNAIIYESVNYKGLSLSKSIPTSEAISIDFSIKSSK